METYLQTRKSDFPQNGEEARVNESPDVVDVPPRRDDDRSGLPPIGLGDERIVHQRRPSKLGPVGWKVFQSLLSGQIQEHVCDDGVIVEDAPVQAGDGVQLVLSLSETVPGFGLGVLTVCAMRERNRRLRHGCRG